MHTPERLIVERGSRTGQPIIVSIDSTRLGPALGGCRIKTYPTWADGVADAVRLSAAMTEKAALAGLDHGGGKTVVALTGPPGDRSHLLADIADVIDSLRGAYLTGPDVGSGPTDMEEIGRRTKYVLCRPEPAGSGDSSGPTALGVTVSLEAVCEHLWPGRDLSSVSFSILGLGHVGARVGAHLAGRGARLVVSDADPQRRGLAEAWGASWATPRDAFRADVDVLVPCAVGGILTPGTVPELRSRAVVGAANNQLDDDSTAELLRERGICWAPDTVVSAGGIIAAVMRELRGESAERALGHVRAIGDRLAEILAAADADATTPLRAARRRIPQGVLRS